MAIETMTILFAIDGIIINVVINSLFFWLAGRALVGVEKAKFIDAISIVISDL